MVVGPTGGVTGPQPIQPNSATSIRQVQGAAGTSATDKAEISLQARLLKKLHDLPPVRQDRIERASREIATGTYESEEKIKAAVDKLMEDLL